MTLVGLIRYLRGTSLAIGSRRCGSASFKSAIRVDRRDFEVSANRGGRRSDYCGNRADIMDILCCYSLCFPRFWQSRSHSVMCMTISSVKMLHDRIVCVCFVHVHTYSRHASDGLKGTDLHNKCRILLRGRVRGENINKSKLYLGDDVSRQTRN